MHDELVKIGLSENEARVYLALLELGSATADEVAKKAGVKRPTTYVQLEYLIKQGLVSSFEKIVKKGGAEKTFFRAEDPEHLKKIVDSKIAKAKEMEDVLIKKIPELSRVFQFGGARPKVRFFEGKEGLQTIQDEFIKMSGKEVLSISNADNILKIFPEHPQRYSPRRVQRGIKSKLIYTSERGDILKKSNKEMLRETKFISPEKFNFSCDFALYDDVTQISTLGGRPVGVLIEDKEITASMRAIFNLLWEGLK